MDSETSIHFTDLYDFLVDIAMFVHIKLSFYGKFPKDVRPVFMVPLRHFAILVIMS
ncbi:hypothetical protein NLX69_02815 [Rossellomorea sp. BNER]|nr:hypothetical protein [Rossellomorea sp. BNER]